MRTLLIDAESGVAQFSSRANGSMLTEALCQPWNAPGAAKQLFASLLTPDAGISIRSAAFPQVVPWGARFIRNSSKRHYWYVADANARLASYSIRCLRELADELRISFAHARSGNIQIFRDAARFEQAAAESERLQTLGLTLHTLSREEAIRVEPALAPIGSSIQGAIHAPGDEVGDAYLFCQRLAEAYERDGGMLRLGVSASGLLVERGEIRGVKIAGFVIRSPRVVIAAGVRSRELLRHAHFALPVTPVKGYTLTFALPEATPIVPHMPIIDAVMHTAVVPLGDRIRVTAIAELTGHHTHIEPARIEQLCDILRQTCPPLANSVEDQQGSPWAGLRPVSADGLPFIGRTQVKGLYINTGHGHLGWTFAAGSARILSTIICGGQPEFDLSPYRPTRNV